MVQFTNVFYWRFHGANNPCGTFSAIVYNLLFLDFFNQMTTMHALIMIFGALMPAFVGLANWQLPMMIGAPDMALPRLNNWSFGFYPLRLQC